MCSAVYIVEVDEDLIVSSPEFSYLHWKYLSYTWHNPTFCSDAVQTKTNRLDAQWIITV